MVDKAEKHVTVKLSDKKNIYLKNDSPDIDSLIKAINELKDELDPKDIEITSTDDNFDCDSFTQVMQEVVSNYLSSIQIDKAQFDAAIESLDSRKTAKSTSE